MPAIKDLGQKIAAQLRSSYGYQPDVSWVSKNMSDEEKQQDLCEHSERYALYFGLLSIPSDMPIIIYNNLRVCGNCHNYTALASKLLQREIRLRDAAVWHIFVDGKCICNGNY